MLDLDKNKKYLLACSYGPDSMALFAVLIKEKYSFGVAHVNYHLRKESDDEEKGLREYCQKHKIEFNVFNVTESISKNIEARCREIRYEYFNNLCLKNGYDALLVAHNEDDLIETYLLQKRRKNLVKYYGINQISTYKNMTVIRPLLSHSKRVLQQYCDDNGIPYAIDKSNLETSFLRNEIRINVVSKMSKTERKDILNQINIKNDQLAKMMIKLDKIEPLVDALLTLNGEELSYYLNMMVNKGGYKFNITHKNVEEVRKMMFSQTTNIVAPVRSGRYVFEKSYGELIFRENSRFNGYSFIIDNPELIDNEYFYANLLSDTSNRNIKLNDYPLTIRTYHSGDTYLIKDYRVQVRRLFIDWKMPQSLRERWPIILNKDGVIIYIPRYRSGFVPEKESNFYVKECFTFH